MKRGHTRLSNVIHAVDGAAAYVQDNRDGDVFDKLGVHLLQKAIVVLATDQVSGGVIR